MRNFTLFFLMLFLVTQVQVGMSQGCVAIRGSACGMNLGTANNVNLGKGEFLAGVGLRYFKSFRHYRGHEEEKHRLEEGTEVINKSYFLDLNLNYGITNRLYANLGIPFVYHDRSSMYEHGGNPPNGLGERHETASRGLADVRFGLGYWLFNPAKQHKFNYALGLGVKLATGSYDYTDTFYNQGADRSEDLEAVVDQSIQPGDGGTGITVDIQGYQVLSPSFVLATNLYYMLSPKETNGVLTRNGSSEFSCPDQYAARLGFFYNNINLAGFGPYLGGRIEGIPSEDLIGGSDGFRRPGYAISVEPGISYTHNRVAINLNVPIAVERNRTQSYMDKQRTEETGVYTHGDAAFADFLVSLNFSYRFGGKQHHMPAEVAPGWNDLNKGN
ncbi:MAG TPA: transporter [Saprospiraceae bacterium]|nr:transporter [Saprospiraceae bacterium]HMQ85170.1 transporter [Saprospiraceae bacterium]